MQNREGAKFRAKDSIRTLCSDLRSFAPLRLYSDWDAGLEPAVPGGEQFTRRENGYYLRPELSVDISPHCAGGQSLPMTSALYIVDGVRTPFCKMGTTLANADAVELGRAVSAAV